MSTQAVSSWCCVCGEAVLVGQQHACRDVARLRERADGGESVSEPLELRHNPAEWHVAVDRRELDAALQRAERAEQECRDVEQTLGRALGYPAYAADPATFPSATQASGVCTGDHSAASLAAEAAERIARLQAEHQAARRLLEAEAALAGPPRQGETALAESDLTEIERRVLAEYDDWRAEISRESCENGGRLCPALQSIQDGYDLLAEVRRLRGVLADADDLIARAACLVDPDIHVRPDVAVETSRRLIEWALRDVRAALGQPAAGEEVRDSAD